MTGLRFLTAGESHGPSLTSILEGIPAGLGLLAEDVDRELARRQRGYGRGGRQRIELDRVSLTGGVRGGETLGGPIALSIPNLDHASWQGRMGAAPFEQPPEPVVRPRPGHADLAGALKYHRHDARDILERASARETAARVAVGAVCRKLLTAAGMQVVSWVLSIGDASWEGTGEPRALHARAEESETRCPDPDTTLRMKAAIHAASHAGDTLGGVFEVQALGAPPGLGSHVHWDRKLDGRLAGALASIQAIKGVEIGLGFGAACLPGSLVHDPILSDGSGGFSRPSNGAGGLEGGVTNGMPIVLRAAMKPIATLRRALPSVDWTTKAPTDAAFERSDVCAVPAASIVGEAMVCIVLAEALLEKTGGDSLGELLRNLEGFRAQVRAF